MLGRQPSTHHRPLVLVAIAAIVLTIPAGASRADSSTPRTIIYINHNTNTPSVRTWNGTDWSAETSLATIGDKGKWAVLRSCPVRNEMLAGFLDNGKDVNCHLYSGGSWGASTEHTADSGDKDIRLYCLAYEQVSGDSLLVYRSGSAAAPRYRTRAAAGWSAEANMTTTLTGTPSFVDLFSDPASNEIIVVYLDANSDIYASVWDGSAFGNGVVLETGASGSTGWRFGGAYLADGTCMVAWAKSGSPSPRCRIWSGSAWGAEAAVTSVGSNVNSVRLASDPAGSCVFLMALDASSHLNLVRWDGSEWGTPVEAETSAADPSNHVFDIAYEPDGTKALAVWAHGSTPYSSSWDGSTWSAAAAGPNIGAAITALQVSPSAQGREILAAFEISGTNEGWACKWDGTTLGDAEKFSAKLNGLSTDEPFMILDCPRGGLVASWTFDGNGTDGALHGNDATVQNGDGDEWVSGRVGSGALGLDGVDDHARTSESATGLQISRDYTTSIWVNADATQAARAGIYAKTDPAGTADHWSLRLGDDGTTLQVLHGANSWNTGISLGTIAGGWHQIAISYRYSDGTIRSYLDGSLVASGTLAAPSSGNGHLNIGAARDEVPFKGKIDELEVQNRVLPAAQVLSLYTGAGPAAGTFTIQGWREKRS